MANAKIDILGLNELPLVVELYNQVFKPSRGLEFFKRRFLGRYNPLIMMAQLDGRPVGFTLGFELKPSVYYAWYYGVLPAARRLGIASQIMEAAQDWARHHQYVSIRMECDNQHRPMLHLAIKHQYDIVGIRWDPDRASNLVLFEKMID
jgi:GNAT superfamily N-acetyltransferase